MLCHYPWNHNFKYIQFWLIFRVQVRSYIKSDVLIKSCFHTTKCDRHELGEKHFLTMVATRKWKKMYGEFNAKDTQTGKCQNSSVWLVNESLYFMFLHELTMAILSDLNNAAFSIIIIKHDCWRSIMSPSERRIVGAGGIPWWSPSQVLATNYCVCSVCVYVCVHWFVWYLL